MRKSKVKSANARRQREYRARQAEAGRTEVRGIYARPERHAEIRAAARRLSDKGLSS